MAFQAIVCIVCPSFCLSTAQFDPIVYCISSIRSERLQDLTRKMGLSLHTTLFGLHLASLAACSPIHCAVCCTYACARCLGSGPFKTPWLCEQKLLSFLAKGFPTLFRRNGVDFQDNYCCCCRRRCTRGQCQLCFRASNKQPSSHYCNIYSIHPQPGRVGQHA